MIALSIIGLFGFYIALFFLPLPHLNESQGNNIGLLLTYPIFWMLGIIVLIARAIVGLWNINQPPILQLVDADPEPLSSVWGVITLRVESFYLFSDIVSE